MNLLIILSLINCGFLLVYFFTKKRTRLTYTESMVIRQITAYTLALLALLVLGFLWLEMYSAFHLLALVISIILAVVMAVYFIRKLFT